jgi:hypothetical protein
MNLHKNANVCPEGDCPKGIEVLKKIGLTPREKRAIFDSLNRAIVAQEMIIVDNLLGEYRLPTYN